MIILPIIQDTKGKQVQCMPLSFLCSVGLVVHHKLRKFDKSQALALLPHFLKNSGDYQQNLRILGATLAIDLIVHYQAPHSAVERGFEVLKMVMGLSHLFENEGHTFLMCIALLIDLQALLIMLQCFGAILVLAVDQGNCKDNVSVHLNFIFL